MSQPWRAVNDEGIPPTERSVAWRGWVKRKDTTIYLAYLYRSFFLEFSCRSVSRSLVISDRTEQILTFTSPSPSPEHRLWRGGRSMLVVMMMMVIVNPELSLSPSGCGSLCHVNLDVALGWLGYSFIGGDWWVEKVRFESFIYRFAGMDWLGGI